VLRLSTMTNVTRPPKVREGPLDVRLLVVGKYYWSDLAEHLRPSRTHSR
jgi:hypothetical protein